MDFELLPQELLGLIGQFLPVQDLARCCEVNQRWRDIFGQDHLWRAHCNPALADHLLETESIVEPHFNIVENESSTLSPIGKWRLIYMRRMHLCKNWKSGNFIKKIAILPEEDTYCSRHVQLGIFYKDNFFIYLKENAVEIWDVRDVPVLHFKAPIKLKPLISTKLYEVYGCDKLVVIQGLAVHVYSINISTKVVQHLHVFPFNANEKTADIIDETVRTNLILQGYFVSFALVKNIVIGMCYLTADPLIHIWNVETGQKLKEEPCPFTLRSCQEFYFCEKTMNVLVDVLEQTGNGNFVHLYVYNLNDLKFLPFHKSFQYNGRWLNFTSQYHSIMFNNCVAIRLKNTLYVYNYFTSELLYTSPGVGVLLHFRNTVLFEQGEFMMVVDPYEREVQAHVRKVLYDRERVTNISDLAIARCEINFRLRETNVTISPNALEFVANKILVYQCSSAKNLVANKHGTKIVLKCHSQLHVVHFW